MTPHVSATHASVLAAELAFQDRFIVRRLPLWLSAAKPAHRNILDEAVRESVRYRQQVQAVLGRIEDLHGFAASRLQAALDLRYTPPLVVDSLGYSLGQRGKPVSSIGPVRTPIMGYEYHQVPLVEAALRNFTLDETTLGGQPPDNGIVDEQDVPQAAPTALQFAKLCRELDMGEQYQQHLSEVLTPASGEGIAAPLQGLLRNAMLVDACQARFDGVLTDAELQRVINLCQGQPLGLLDGHRVVAKQLKILGCTLQQVVVLDALDERFSPLFTRSSRVLVYIPGDPLGAWSAFDDLATFARKVLDKRLRDSGYQAFFRRFVLLRDSYRFFTQVLENYGDLPPWATRDLDEAMQAYPDDLFTSLVQARVAQIKDDAALLAMPVASIDRNVQQEQAQWLEQLGWTALVGASFFVPGLGLVLLAVSAWEMLTEVFQGLEAWREGDIGEATDHLLNVAKDAAMLAATAAGATLAQRAWARSRFVDGLVPARMDDGTHKLWNQDLTPYRETPPPTASAEDGAGIRRLDTRQWVAMDGFHYRVEAGPEPGQWQLPTRQGHSPLIVGNGAGAWRLWSAQPHEWADDRRLLRSLGRPFTQLDDAHVAQVLTSHDMRTEHLRALHILHQAPPAELADTALRLRLDTRIGAFVEQLGAGQSPTDITLLQHAQRLPDAAGLTGTALGERLVGQRPALLASMYNAVQETDSAEGAVLRRLFPSLTQRSAEQLLREASAEDFAQLRDRGRVGLRLGQAARLSALRIRVARVYEGMQIDAGQNLDTARVVLGLLKHLPGGEDTGWRLFDLYRSEHALFSTAGGGRTLDLLHVNGQFRVLEANGGVIAERQGLFQALVRAFDTRQLQGMGLTEPYAERLREKVLGLAVEHRQAIEQGFGKRLNEPWFIAPQRLSDGRMGYPLSGRAPGGYLSDRPRALLSWVRMIYPDFTDQQVDAWIAQVLAADRDVATELDRLDREFTALRRALRTWTAEADTARIKGDREHLTNHLLVGWQRVGAVGPEGARPIENLRLTVYGIKPGGLPELPPGTSFAHITELGLPDMQLRQVPSSFLAAFPRLAWLDLSGSRLARIPDGIERMEHLRGLVLANNRIVLNAQQSTALANCWGLEHLNLSHNPLGRAFSVADLTGLRLLDLRNTGIGRLPPGLLDLRHLLMADLRGNAISEMPEAFFTRPAILRRALRLDGNTFHALQWQRLTRSIASAAREVEGSIALLRFEEQQLDGIEPRERWASEVPVTQRGLLVASWDKVLTYQGTDPLFRVLRQLLRSADFMRQPGNMAQRVFTVLDEMASDPELCQALVDVANDEWGCRDGATWCFSNLEIEIRVWHASQGDAASGELALFRLARQLWRLDEVDRIAVQDILGRGGDPDQSEVGLAYRVGLRERLDLPIETTSMSYSAVAGVSQPMLDQAYGRVLAAESPERLVGAAVDRTFWQAYLQRTYPDRFAAMNEPFQQRLQALEDGGTDHEALASTIHVDQQVARRELMLELTRQSLGRMMAASRARVT
jgi:hypothetical protein